MKAVYFEKHGGPEVLRYGAFPDPEIGPQDVLLRVRACSLNYLDIFSRRGLPGIAIDVLGSNGWRREDLTALIDLVAAAKLEPVIDCVLPLEQGIEACRLLEDRAFFGKIVVRP